MGAWAGASLVMLVDPKARSVTLIDARGRTKLSEADVLAHEALPGFSLSLARLFGVLERV